MSGVYFGTVYQIVMPLPTVQPITNFRLTDGRTPTDICFAGIPFIVKFLLNGNARIGLYDISNNQQFTQNGTEETVATILINTDTDFLYSIKEGEVVLTFDTVKYYFSTLRDGNKFNGLIAIPPDEKIYNIYRYFTQLKQDNVNLNTSTIVTLGWSSTDISGTYGNDIATVRIFKDNGTRLVLGVRIPNPGTLQAGPFNITNNQTIPTALFSTIQSGTYYYTYDFNTLRIAALTSAGYPIDYEYAATGTPEPVDQQKRTGTFTFITQFLQFVSATNIFPGGTSTISINVGVGYPGNSYTLSVNDRLGFSTTTTFPFTYTPPPEVNTITYTATVSASSDTNDTNTRSTTFIAYQFITNIVILTRILQSERNFLSWNGGSNTEQFQYGTTAITTINGSLNFENNDKMDASGLVAGTAYAIQPTNINENSGSYTPFYFDSIAPNQQIQIESNRSLQTYTLTWDAYYTASSPAPDGTRQYAVTFTGNGNTYTGTSTYNVVTIPFSAVTFGIPYNIQVVDIIVATNIYFFDKPTNFAITPNKINFSNTITWVSNGNPVFNVRMGRYLFQSSSPFTVNLTQDIIDLTGDVYFWPFGATESSSILTDSYNLSANTISITLPSSILIFSGATISFDVGSYLYPADTYSLSLYRNGAVVQQLEASITNPFTWIPYKYTVTYQPGDQLYIKSNQHLNFGISTPFTLILNTPVNVSVTPSRINFENTISWSLENNPVVNVRMGRYVFQSSSPYTYNFTEDIINPIGNISFWPIGSDPSNAIVASTYNLSANTISITLPSSILPFSDTILSFDVGSYLYPTDTYSLSLYRNGAVVQQLEAFITNPFTWIPYKYAVMYQPGDQLYIKSNQHLNFGISSPFTIIVNPPTNVRVTPSRINFENTISWLLENNPVLNVRIGDYVFQSSSPYTYNFIEDMIDLSGNISFWAIGADPSNAVVASSYTLSANTIFIALSSSMPIFSGVFFSYDIGAVLYRNDTYSMSLYRNGTVVEELEAVVANPFTWFPYKYAATYQPGDQIYVKSNQHLNFGLSVPFTFQVNASVTVDQSVYTIFSTIVATMTIDADTAFTVRLNGATNIPVAFTQEGNQYTIQLKDYNLALGNYQLDFLLVNSPTIIVSSPSFLVTTSVTVDQPEYTIISTVNATVYVGVPTTFTVVLQDVDQLFPPISLPSFTANLLSTYSFRLYGLPLTDANYVLQFTAGTVITSPVFFISQSYFSFDELILPIPPSRATTNTLCVTTKKNNLPTTIISIKNNIVYPTAIRGQRQYLVPCGIIPYLKELTELLKTLSLRDALLFLIQKYNIPQNTQAVANKTRYQLPTANSKILKPIVQYSASFRLSASTTGVSVGNDIRFVDKLSDARFLTLCNDDTKTFSTLYTDMLKNATYWISTLPRFTKDGDFTYCVVRPVNGSLKQILTASITLVNNRFVFTPYILRLVLAFYQPYGAIDITIMYSSKSLIDIYNYLVAAYEKIYLNPATAL